MFQSIASGAIYWKSTSTACEGICHFLKYVTARTGRPNAKCHSHNVKAFQATVKGVK